jgi:hypothetical protein
VIAATPRTTLGGGLGILLVAGCVTHGRIGAMPAVPRFDEAAEIVVIRDHRIFGGALTVSVVLDGVPVYGIDAGEHVILRVPAGEHLIAASHSLAIDSVNHMIDAQPGRRYYMRLQPTMGSGMVPTPVAAPEGEALMVKTTLVE